MDQIGKIFCVVGPGSFTGLRVGINFSKTLAYSIGCPMGKINTLDLLALNAHHNDEPILSTIDAQKNSIFYSIYKKVGNRFSKIESDRVITIKQLNQIVKERMSLCGSGLSKYWDFLDDEVKALLHGNQEFEFCNLTKIIEPNSFIQMDQMLSWNEIQPLYIKASAPEEKLNPTT